jgi:hypothetical protein
MITEAQIKELVAEAGAVMHGDHPLGGSFVEDILQHLYDSVVEQDACDRLGAADDVAGAARKYQDQLQREFWAGGV